jgi:GDP-L-fucose synthase
MPTNLYGPGDNYHPENSHVLPALINRFHDAKERGLPEVCIWGSGKPRRELLHVDDLADGLLHLLGIENPPDWVNLGTGKDQTILELASMVKEVVGFNGEITHDLSKPDGTPIKRLDTSLMDSLGWSASIMLREGIEKTYDDFKERLRGGTLRR